MTDDSKIRQLLAQLSRCESDAKRYRALAETAGDSALILEEVSLNDTANEFEFEADCIRNDLIDLGYDPDEEGQ